MLEDPHIFSSNHRKSIIEPKECGCFYCLKFFKPNQIKRWCDIDENEVGQTALCPYCGIDSVLGDHDIELNTNLLWAMHQIWF